jgi:hypothetical protein
MIVRDRVNGVNATGNAGAMRDTVLATTLALSSLIALPRAAHAQPPPLRVQLRVPAERSTGVLAAVAAELDRPVVAAAAGACAAPCLVIAIGDDAAVADVRYIGAAGDSRARAVALPADSGAAAETIGLLADNLVRDEASDLLAAMAEAAPITTVSADASGPAAVGAFAPPPVAAAVVVAAPPSAAPAAIAPAAVVVTDVKPRTFFSVGLVPPLSADLTAVGQVRHGFSVDLLVGVSGGADGFSVSGVVDVERGLVDGVQLAGVGALAETVDGGQIGGAFSIARRVEGAQLGGALAISTGPVEGTQLAGALVIAGSSVDGIQIGGAGALAGGRIGGGQLAGAAAIAGGTIDGVQIAGAAALARAVDGFQTAGALAIAAGDVDGVQIGGAVAAAGGNVDGVQIGGAVSATRGHVDGLQMGGAVNVAGGRVDGAQIAGAVNIGGDVDGFQLAPVNIAGRIDGVQVGVVNVARAGDGASIGLVTLVPGGRTDVEASIDSGAVASVMLRHGSRRWHNVYGIAGKSGDQSTDRMVEDDDIWMYGLGMGPTWYRDKLIVDLDAMAWQVNLGADHEDDLSLLAQLRLSAGYDLGPVTLVGGVIGNAYISTFADAGDIDLTGKADLAKRPPSAGNHDGEPRVTIWPTAFVGVRL